jgi:uncharacterized membrane protein
VILKSTLAAIWLPVLAELPSNPAERTGYIVGIAVGVLLMMAVGVFAIVAIVKAFTKKTTGWIVAAVIGGLLLLIPVGLTATGFIVGFKRGFEGARQRSAASTTTQTVTGKVIPFTIEVPGSWRVKRSEGAFDVLAENGNLFVGVIAEEGDLGDSATVAEFARKRIEQSATEVTLGDVEPVTFDGRPWLAFTVKCKVQKIPFAYQFYVHTGPQGTLQIMGWTWQNVWDRDAAALQKTMQTLHFPPPKEPAPAKP